MALTSGIELISPNTASKLLQTWSGNRKISKLLVDRYAKAMSAGQFESLNGETIKISTSGKLVDGQHRMLALIEYNKALKFIVVRGVNDSSFVTIDSGKTRSVGDVAGIAGVPNSNTAAAAARIMIQIECLGYVTDEQSLRPSKTEVVDYLVLHNKVIQEAIHTVQRCRVMMLLGPSIPVAIYAMAKKGGCGLKADQFMDELGSGIFDAEDVTKHPVYLLRQRVIQLKAQRVRYTVPVMCGLVIKAWNAHAQNRKIGQVRFNAGEAFPAMFTKP